MIDNEQAHLIPPDDDEFEEDVFQNGMKMLRKIVHPLMLEFVALEESPIAEATMEKKPSKPPKPLKILANLFSKSKKKSAEGGGSSSNNNQQHHSSRETVGSRKQLT